MNKINEAEPKNQNIFKLDLSSDEDEGNSEVLEDEKNELYEKLNPEKNSLSNSKDEREKLISESNAEKGNSFQNNSQFRYQPLRRNKSFKVKKEENDLNNSKVNFNKSVSKFGNIFKEAEEINLKSESRFVVYQEIKKEQNTEQSVKNLFEIDFIEKNQEKPILKLSENSKIVLNPSGSPRKIVRFIENNDLTLRKTSYTEKPMNELIGKKLSQTENRPTTRSLKTEIKVRLRTEEITDIKAFVHKKINSAQVLITTIKKDTSGFNWFWPVYKMKDEKSKYHILSAKKKSANTTSNYYISSNEKEIDVQNASYMGKVRSNFIGSCFNIFNQGCNPENFDHQENKSTKVRQLLATVIYESQVVNANPKSMRVYVIKHPLTYYDLEGTSVKEEERNLEEIYKIGQNKEKIYLFKNRQPIYNKKENKFVLSFDGRVKMPSTENFILEDPETKKEVLLFGKIQEDEYLMHISSPLTPHIAMGVALSELDSKIICE